MLVVASLVLAQVATGGWSNRRPSECADDGGRRPNVWERAKSPELRHYCDLLASASSKLAGTSAMATAALEAARQAEKVLPGRGAPRVLEGRALAVLGQLPEALAALNDGRARDPRSLDDPRALLALARVLAGTEHTAEAAVAYRALMPRAAGFSTSERTQVAVEAGFVAMALGPGGLEDAEADLREALREAQQGDVEGLVVLALALALDRAGRADEARALLAERSHGDPRSIVSAWLPKQSTKVPASEGAALAALSLEGSDPAGARDAWQEHLRLAPRGPWASYAQSRLAALMGRRARVGSPR